MSDQTAQQVPAATPAPATVDAQHEHTADHMPTVLGEGRIP